MLSLTEHSTDYPEVRFPNKNYSSDWSDSIPNRALEALLFKQLSHKSRSPFRDTYGMDFRDKRGTRNWDRAVRGNRLLRPRIGPGRSNGPERSQSNSPHISNEQFDSITHTERSALRLNEERQLCRRRKRVAYGGRQMDHCIWAFPKLDL